jgi:hypothetical protein
MNLDSAIRPFSKRSMRISPNATLRPVGSIVPVAAKVPAPKTST